MRKNMVSLTIALGVLGATVAATAQQRPQSQWPKGASKKEIVALQQDAQSRTASAHTPMWSDSDPANDPSGPPANDNCADAQAVAVPSSTNGTNVGATADAAVLVEFCGASGSAANRESVWYSLTGTGNLITLSTCNAFSDANHPDTKISVHTDGCGTLTCVDGNDDNCAGFNGFLSTVSFCSVSGTQYWINVRGFGVGDTGGFQLDVSEGAMCGGGPGQDCNSAEVISATSFTSTGNHGGWFTFTATDEFQAIETCGSTFDTGISVFDSCGGIELKFNDDCDQGFFGAGSDPNASCFNAALGTSCFCFDSEPGTQYWLFAGVWNGSPPPAGETLDLTLTAKPNCGPVSACCADASGTCFDDNPPGGCFAGETEYPNLTCAEVEANGDCPDQFAACCQFATGNCFDDLPGNCFPDEIEFPFQTCAEIEGLGLCEPPPPCELSCEPGSTPEGDPTCGLPTDTVNGGCNVMPTAYQTISCGQTYCGTSRAEGGSRDLDWFHFTLTEPTEVSWTITAQYPVNIIIWPFDVCPPPAPIAFVQAGDCETGSASVTLPAGEYTAFMGPQLFEGTACGAIYNATLECTPTDACCDGNTGICTDNVPQDQCGTPPPDIHGASGLNIPVPDGGGPGSCATHVINVAGAAFNVSDVNVGLELTHSWVGDVTVSVEHNATTVMIIDRPGVPASTFGCASNNYDIVLDDEGGGGSVETFCEGTDAGNNPPSPPNYVPNNPLSAFDGMPALGNWTIRICDFVTPDTGPLTAWSVQFPGTGGPDPLFSWHPETNCSDVNCVIQNGACCNNQTGVCTNDVFEADCDGVDERWELQVDCVDLNPPCEPPRGACCNDATGVCTSLVFEANCLGVNQRWAEGVLCANIFPPCEGPTGACCDTATGQCSDGLTEEECLGPQPSPAGGGVGNVWAQDQDCADIVCGVPPVPTVTQWGLIIMTLAGLALGSVLFGRRLRAAESA